MKFEEVFPAYKEGRTIKYDVHKFKQGKASVIHTNWLDSEDWSVCSKIDEYLDILRDVPCVDFRPDEAGDMFDLNVIDIMEDWDVDTELSKEHELKEITWYIPRKTQIHFVTDSQHLIAVDTLTLEEGGMLRLYTKQIVENAEFVNKVELIYLTGEYW